MSVVLVVEDDVEIRATLRMALEDDAYTVLEAPNGEDAIAQLHSNREPMVVLLDLLLPLLSGEPFSSAWQLTQTWLLAMPISC